MSVRFVIGRAGSGKSSRCLAEIRERLSKEANGHPLILLVPEQATFQAEYALITTPGISGIIRAQALSFRRLAFRVMQEVGGMTRIHIDDTGKKMLLHKIIRRRREQLRVFRQTAEQAGFIDSLNDMFNELKRYCITADKLSGHLRGGAVQRHQPPAMLADKLHDLSILYTDFENELSRHYVDSEDYLGILAGQIEHSAYVRDAEVWVDGFYGFTPQEFAVIDQLIRCCRRVTVTLCLDREYAAGEKPDELDLFHPTALTMARLQQRIEELGAAREETVFLDDGVPRRFASNPLLAHLERGYERKARWNGDADGPRSVPPSGQAPGRPDKLQAGQSSVSPLHGDAGSNEAGLSIHAAVHRRAEVEGVAREIVRLVRDRGYRWRDIAVMMRDMQAYRDLLATTFADYGIPYFFDQKRPVLNHPLVEFIRSALEIVNHNWRYDAVFRCVKTEFLLPLDPSFAQDGTPAGKRGTGYPGKPDEDANGNGEGEREAARWRNAMDVLENYVLAFGIQGSRWTDSRDWEYRHGASLEDEPGESSEREEAYLRQINEWRRMISAPLLAFQKQMNKAGSVKEMCEALFGLLESVLAAERLERWSGECLMRGQPEKAREHAQIWESVLDVLDQTVEMMGGETMSLGSFADILETGLASIRLGLVPPSLDQVLVGSIERTRSSRIKHCFLLGVNDGVLPARASEDGVLSEPERELLIASGLEMAPESRRRLLDEQFLIYTAMTTPSDHLWVSYSLADEEGRALLPSEVIRRLKHMFPGIREELLLAEPPFSPDNEPSLQFIARAERAMSHLLVQLRQWMRGTEIADVWWDVYNWLRSQPAWRGKLDRLLAALFYTNREPALSEATSRRLYGEHLRASVSRMERFVACPFSQFASHGLRLQERRVFRLEAPDIGQLFHAALSLIALKLQEEQTDWGELTAEQCRDMASEAVERLSPRLQGEILLSSKRYHYIAHKLKNVVGRASIVLGEHARRGAFAPVGVELGFGPGQPLPPLTFTLDNGCTMEIVGRIDRVDRADGEKGMLLRVIDYKSSQKTLHLSDVYYGLSLQMLTYLDVVITHAERWLGKKAKPAGVLYFHVHNPLLQTTGAIPPDEAEEYLFKRFKMKGLVLADRTVVNMMDSRLDTGYSSVIPVGLKTDGSFRSNSSVITEEQWEQLRNYVRHTIREIGTGITNGRVDIRPYRMGTRTPCSFCPYKPVCQFDPLFEGNEFAALETRDKEEVWTMIANDFAFRKSLRDGQLGGLNDAVHDTETGK